MSVTEVPLGSAAPETTRKRKFEQDNELEVQLDAPEPPSKKALRKAKKAKGSKTDEDDIHVDRKEHIAQGKNETAGIAPPVFKEQPKRTDFGIWIGNLAFTTTVEDLQSFLISNKVSPVAAEDIARINLPKDVPKNGQPKNKGFAYVDFTNQAAVEKALQLSEKLLTGRRVLIKDAKDFEGRPKATEAEKPEVQTSKRLFVGNLAFDATRESLKAHFEACGPVADVFLTTFEDSGKCKGYGWVTFEGLPSATAAMRGWVEVEATEKGKNGKRRRWVNMIEGRKLRLEYAESATTRYNKRHGQKGARKGEGLDVQLGEVDATGTSVRKLLDKKKGNQGYNRERTAEQKGDQSGRYDDSTVAKLKGSIVKGKGTKVVFE